MVEQVFEKVRRSLLGGVTALDANALTPGQAAAVVEVLTGIEKLAAGGRLLLLARAAQDQRWRQSGDVSAADRLARQAGTTPGALQEAIKTSEQLAGLASTRAAVVAGRLSPQQAVAVAAAAAKDPAAETALLGTAEREPLSGLRDECARVAAAATDQSERDRIQHRNRSFRTWSDQHGSLCGRFSLPAVTGAELLAILNPFRDQAFTTARRQGRHDNHDNHAADGLMLMARAADTQRSAPLHPATLKPAPAENKPRAGPRARIQVRCDYFALRRGWVDRGEVAEIPGIGPISIPAVRQLFDDSIIDILVTKGRDVTTIATNTRYIPQPLRIALTERDPVCFIAGCHRRYRLEHDHQTLFSQTQDTSITNLHRACTHHHNLKTNHGHQFVNTPHG